MYTLFREAVLLSCGEPILPACLPQFCILIVGLQGRLRQLFVSFRSPFLDLKPGGVGSVCSHLVLPRLDAPKGFPPNPGESHQSPFPARRGSKQNILQLKKETKIWNTTPGSSLGLQSRKQNRTIFQVTFMLLPL